MRGVTKLAPGPGNVALAERAEPEPGRGEVVVAVHAAGICGTDLHIEAGQYPSVPPVTMGHELCGLVAVVGDGVDAAWLGARVTSETFYATCGKCRSCRAGRPNLCERRQSIGTHVDGAFAPLVRLPAHGLHRVPPTVSDAAGALCEPLACVWNSLHERSTVTAGDQVLVSGPGPIGLLAAQVARAAGASVHVRGASRDAIRLELARALGFETSAEGRDPPLAPESFDVVVECSGSEAGIAAGLRAVRRAGRYVQIGLRGADVSVPFDQICLHELVVTAGFASTPASWRGAMRALEEGAVALEPLVSEVVELAAWRRAFDAARRAEAVKVVLDPR